MTGVVIYKGTDVDITINVTGLTIGSMSEITVTLQKAGQSDISFTKTGGAITVDGSSLNLRIDDGTLIDSGVYAMRLTATVSGDVRGLSLTPDRITVK